MLTFLAVVAIAVGVVYVISKKMLVEPASIMKPLPKAPEPVVKVDRVIKMNTRLQKESGIPSETLYRRTQQGLLKLEARLLHLAGKVRNIRGK